MRYTISEVLDRIGLDHKSNKLDCPWCGKKKKMGFNDDKGMYHCYHCHKSGGALAFYSEYVLGTPLPSDAKERGEISGRLREFMGDSNQDNLQHPTIQRRQRNKPKRIPLASDDKLHAVYSMMASLPMLQLLPEHRTQLQKRGLSDQQIDKNGYRSYPATIPIPDHIKERYNSVDMDLRKDHSTRQAAHIQIGLLIADLLLAQGLPLEGVPGFYRFGDYWCLTYIPGILIPTRNLSGQIVIWQVRRKINPKYMTLSCGSKPGAVTDEVSRCHFPLGSKLSPDIPLYVTEGPLKADVAMALYGKPVAFAAIPGIETTKDLLSYCPAFLKAGVKCVLNALDMDRLTNPNVRRGSRKLEDAFRQNGLTVVPMYWGETYAANKCMALSIIAKLNNIPVDVSPTMSVYERLDAAADALTRAEFNAFQRGDKEPFYWESETKGIDDFLFNKRKQNP